jgi:hypothetical protein
VFSTEEQRRIAAQRNVVVTTAGPSNGKKADWNTTNQQSTASHSH